MRKRLTAVAILLVIGTYCHAEGCSCESGMTTDEWTDEPIAILFCTNPDEETWLQLLIPDESEPRVSFYDPDARARDGTLVSWEYRVGNTQLTRIAEYWNHPELSLPGQEEHIRLIVDGLSRNEKIRFRFNPLTASIGETRTFEDCKNTRRTARRFYR